MIHAAKTASFFPILAFSFAMSLPALAQTAPNFGPNVVILDPSMPAAEVQSTLTALAAEDQFSANRHAIFFKPGTYIVQAPVGYYESFYGLGATPGAVTINGFLTPNYGSAYPGTNLTDTFWRSLENMTVNPVQNKAQNAAPNTLQWGVSQAAPLRRMQINGNLQLTNSYCGNSSGGFMSDLVVTGNVNPCSQQQWYTRNSTLGSWNGGVWNMVFSGVQGAPAPSFPNPPETVVPTTPVSREKPFLYLDAKGNYNVFAPGVKHNSTGTTWRNGIGNGRTIPIANFFIANPSTSITDINNALLNRQNLILTPGIYKISRPLHVYNANTVVLGLGYATLVPQNGTAAITVEDVSGVQIAGLIIDAGPVNSPVLLQMGTDFGTPLPPGGKAGHAGNPSVLSDITLRVAGATAGLATTSLEVDSSDVVLDNIWAWRADHGNGAGWSINLADHGLVVNGNHVTALGLAVEHFQKEQVLWNGSAGETIFYQSELPYDPPSQAAWMDGNANGYPSYVVTGKAKTHTAYGLGIYSFFNQGLDIVEDNAMTVPNTTGIAIHDAGTVFLTGKGSITHVINGVGNAVNSGYADKVSPVVSFP